MTSLVIASVVALSAVGCAGPSVDIGGDYSAQRAVAEDFMTALQEGRAEDAAAMMSGTAGVPADALDDAFYAEAEGFPEDAAVDVASQAEGTVRVTMRYRLAGDEREITFFFEQDAETPRITGWSNANIAAALLDGDGELVVSDVLPVALEKDAVYFALLPGSYRMAFEGTAIDPAGATTSSFIVDFPVESGERLDDLPEGVAYDFSVLQIGG